MALQKPAPLMIDGKAYYTLTSYDPAEITINMPLVTDDDVELALEALLSEGGYELSDLDDPQFISQNFEGCSTKDELLAAFRRHMQEANQQAAEEEKPTLVAEDLAQRLAQSIPEDQIARVRLGLEAQLRDQIEQQGLTWSQFLRQSGGELAVEHMINEQASRVAEQDAALAAYAQHEHLTVERNEIPHLLGVPLEHAQEFLDQIEASGHTDDFREGALRAKAASVAVAKSSYSYRYETPEEAADRIKRYRELRSQLSQESDQGGAEKPASAGKAPHDPSDGSHLKLV